MISVRHSEIPSYLHPSAFYCSLNSDDDGEIQVPADAFKDDDLVADVNDFALLLKVVKFWGLDKLPEEVIKFCGGNSLSAWESSAAVALGSDSTHFSNLQTIFNPRATKATLALAIEHNQVDIAEHYILTGAAYTKTLGIFLEIAAQYGRLSLLVLMHENGFMCRSRSAQLAAENGHLDCLQYLHKRGCPWDTDIGAFAAKNGHADCLRYIFEVRGLDERNYAVAADEGYLECLKVLQEYGYKWANKEMVRACQNGHLPCVQFLHEVCFCGWGKDDTFGASLAARGNHVGVLRYAMENGCPCERNLHVAAADAGSLDALMYLVQEQHLPIDTALFSAAFNEAHVECVRYLLESGYPVSTFEFQHNNTFFYSHGRTQRAGFDECFLQCIQLVQRKGWEISASLKAFVGQYASALRLCVAYLRE